MRVSASFVCDCSRRHSYMKLYNGNPQPHLDARVRSRTHTLETVHTIIMRVRCVCACASHYKSYAENK